MTAKIGRSGLEIPKSPTPEALVALKTASGMTWQAVADLCSVGESTVHRWRDGTHPMPGALWEFLCLRVYCARALQAQQRADLIAKHSRRLTYAKTARANRLLRRNPTDEQ